LEEQIKRLAENLRVPVSNLVRNMLEDALVASRRLIERSTLPGGVVDEAGGPDNPNNLADVYGWQGLTINQATPCVRCGRQLVAGEEAYLGLTDRPRDTRVFCCSACLPRPGQDSNEKGDIDGRQG
jgi:hypothetical protein